MDTGPHGEGRQPLEHGAHAGQASRAIDPVCGMSVETDTAQHRTTHRGRPYYFCCAGCKAKFEANLNHYLEASTQAPEPVVEGAIYTCPMHPEVRQVGPG